MSLPRLMIAAASSGQGKTTIATGLMAALTSAGHLVSGHKVGPDYIDPGYHALACGRPGRNLDPHLVGEERVAPLLLHGARGADVAIIEGAMGLHDGRIGGDGFASTAHVAALTRTPVVLVVDISRISRSAGAVVAGLAAYDPAIEVVGVILNRAGSARNIAEVRRAISLPVVGALPRDESLTAPSRHLGLVPAAERIESARIIERLGEQVARHIDLDAVVQLAGTAPPLDDAPWDPAAQIAAAQIAAGRGRRPVVAMAGGRAFTFRYAETEELLAAAGCDVVSFDPLADTTLPEGTRGIYLGGGFPEAYAGDLAANRSLLADLRSAVAGGVPTVAECAGLLYLAETLDGAPMAAALPAAAAMTGRLTLGYQVATAAGDSLLTRAGEQVSGHEFHRTETTPAEDGSPAWEIDGRRVGFASPTLHASYHHVHWAGHPQLAQRFAAAVHARRARANPLADPLRHHGDAETGPGLLDFAVNVYAGQRPGWLDRALRESLDAAAAYPDARPAQEAIAQRHGRRTHEVLPTAGAAEAFDLLARLRPWRRPVVVHPQFTEPHAALERAGATVTTVLCRPEAGFALDPAAIPEDADLVVIGNPTNPTGVLHPAETIRRLRRRGRLVVVDEAFMDAVPGESESLVRDRLDGVVVVRSLTKHWSIPGVRAGYVVGESSVVRELRRVQVPWSVSASAVAAAIACCSEDAAGESRARASTIGGWRELLEAGLRDRDIDYAPSAAPFVLARPGESARSLLRACGIAVRRADTFPGLDGSWIRIAVRPPDLTLRLFAALDTVLDTGLVRGLD